MQNVYTQKNDATKLAEEVMCSIRNAIECQEDMLSEQEDHIRDELVDMLIKDGTLSGHSDGYEIMELNIKCAKSPIGVCVFDSTYKDGECHFCYDPE